MAEITAEDVEAARSYVQELRDEVESAKVELAMSEAGRANEHELTMLVAEGDALKREYDELRERIKTSKETPVDGAPRPAAPEGDVSETGPSIAASPTPPPLRPEPVSISQESDTDDDHDTEDGNR